MGNCTGIFSSCQGTESSSVKKIDPDAIKKAIEMKIENDLNDNMQLDMEFYLREENL
jgi:hypothetical protein